MSFTSLVFFIYLPAVILIYWLTPNKFRLIPLLIASYLFYAFYNVWLLSLIFATTGVSYVCGILTEKAETKKGKRAAVAIAVIVCLGLLFTFKYLDFVLSGAFAFLRLCGAEVTFNGFNLILPMGISFYVFQTMSYTFDVYRGKIAAEKNLGYYALFVVFFPQLVAGPIERPADLIPQLRGEHKLNKQDFSDGARHLLIGYAQKILVADFVAKFVNAAYADVYSSGGLALIIATLLFALQIYCDFSGYSRIAVGCAKLMGINLTINFNHPYRAQSIRDFWRRWHITLTKWLTDYVYIPLGGNRKGKFRQILNILIVFLISGLWHGANLTYVVWGLLHGALLAIQSLLPAGKKEKPAYLKAFFCVLTFITVCFIWIFFRSSTLTEAGEVFRSVFSDWKVSQTFTVLDLSLEEILPLCLSVAAVPLLENIPSFQTENLPLCKAKSQVKCALTYFVLIMLLAACQCYILTVDGASTFIYFSF